MNDDQPHSPSPTSRDASPAVYVSTSQPPPPSTAQRITCSSDVYQAMRDLCDADREHFVVFELDVRHRLCARRIIAIGSLTGVEVHPREVFRPAIAAGACAVIFAHNHPSGDATPSRQDIEITARLREVGELCGIPVLDHVVVAAGGFVSLAQRGWV